MKEENPYLNYWQEEKPTKVENYCKVIYPLVVMFIYALCIANLFVGIGYGYINNDCNSAITHYLLVDGGLTLAMNFFYWPVNACIQSHEPRRMVICWFLVGYFIKLIIAIWGSISVFGM